MLSQPARLPGYDTFTAAGVTIAFLDSGYYPHPDFTAAAQWPGAMPAWHQLDQGSLHELFAQADLRLTQYVDLTDDGEQVGLETPSLWDGAGDSWHGQMTMAVAAGNGLLSDGVYRGYAAGASLLPVKIGRGGGRIPEADILRGLTWLLDDDNWQRYGVRVVNISVGGDFPQDWQHNPVCRAAHALAQRGVFVAAAAGNRGAEELLAPAQTPTVMTVGGVDDQNRRWRPTRAARSGSPDALSAQFRHGDVAPRPWSANRKFWRWPAGCLRPSCRPAASSRKPTPSNSFGAPSIDDEADLEVISQHAAPSPHAPRPALTRSLARSAPAHECAQVAAAPTTNMWTGPAWPWPRFRRWPPRCWQANPALTGEDVRQLLMESALALPHLLPRQTGAGLLQPTLAVAAALRAPGGPLVGYPRSGVALKRQ